MEFASLQVEKVGWWHLFHDDQRGPQRTGGQGNCDFALTDVFHFLFSIKKMWHKHSVQDLHFFGRSWLAFCLFSDSLVRRLSLCYWKWHYLGKISNTKRKSKSVSCDQTTLHYYTQKPSRGGFASIEYVQVHMYTHTKWLCTVSDLASTLSFLTTTTIH